MVLCVRYYCGGAGRSWIDKVDLEVLRKEKLILPPCGERVPRRHRASRVAAPLVYRDAIVTGSGSGLCLCCKEVQDAGVYGLRAELVLQVVELEPGQLVRIPDGDCAW